MSGLKRLQSNGYYLDYTPASALTAGDVVVEGTLAMVADDDIAIGQLGALSTHGVYSVPKDGSASVVFALGALVAWDESGKLAVATTTGDVELGVCVKASIASDTSVQVKLLG